MTPYQFIACPNCGGSVEYRSGSLVCERGHCFDVSKEGYVNLLPPGRGKNAHTGDDKDMIRARTQFLSLGLYDRISDTAAEFALKHLSASDSIVAVDAGCGEGYHTCRIVNKLYEISGAQSIALGFDASKTGAAAGAKHSFRLGLGGKLNNLQTPLASAYFAAGNIFSLPVVSGCADAIFSLFAPIPGDEAMRILKDSGVLVVVASGAKHLWELRELLYDEPREGDGSLSVPGGFTVVGKESLIYTARVPDNDSLQSLFTMTPFYYRTPESGRNRLKEREFLDITVNTDIYVLKKI